MFVDDACITVGGNVPNKPCIFPFTYHNVDYTSCTWARSDIYARHSQPWCPTTTDEQGNYEDMPITIGGAEGYCGGQGCSFPVGKAHYI